MNQDYTDVCPLLDRPTGGRENYLQPVQVNRNIELVTRNLPPEVKEITMLLCLDYCFNFSIDFWFQLHVLCEWNKTISYLQQSVVSNMCS